MRTPPQPRSFSTPPLSPRRSWIAYINPLRYAWAAMIKSEMRGLTFACQPGATCVWTSGEQVLSTLDVGDLSPWENIAVMAGIFLALRIMGVFITRRSVKRELKRRT